MLKKAIKSVLSPPIVVAVVAVGPVYGQEATDQVLEDIIVTGSRISRDSNLESSAPVQSVSGDDIQLSGEIDIADVINDIPSLLTTSTAEASVNSVFETTANADGSGVGQQVLQLRGLGVERTLVLVNGRRHVAGVEGSQSVDIGSIPAALIDRVEVLTGGASAIYGADAVTGVVNFVLKEDFEGLDVDVQTGLSSRGDGETYALSALYGQNFGGDRGNFTVAVDISRKEELLYGERSFARNNGLAAGLEWSNPDLFFQQGEINGSTPNLAQFYDPNVTGRFPYGFSIPSQQDFIDSFTAEFGAAPTLTSAEQSLFNRAVGVPTNALRAGPNFSISSQRGVIAPGDFSNPNIDLNGNGTPDCLDSYIGYESSLDFPFATGIIGGCWVVNDDGSVRPYRDGTVAGSINQFFGDGIEVGVNGETLIPRDDKLSVNLTGRYDLADNATLFGELKYVAQEVEFQNPQGTFWDLLSVFPDNPFIPQELQALAIASAPNDPFGNGTGLYITRDPVDLGPNRDQNDRTTIRFVTGLEGEFANGMTYEFSANYGKFEREFFDNNTLLVDRWYAAIDATTDANGNPVCRSELDGSLPPSNPFGIPAPWDPGFFTFNPGDGQCVPANLLGGRQSISQAAVDFITTTTVNEFELEQIVFSAIFNGETSFGLEAGGIGYAFGFEYRDEESRSLFDPINRGVLPVNTTFGNAGDNVADLGLTQVGLTFASDILIQDAIGSYDVTEVFGEVNVPLLVDAPGAKSLNFDAAVRFADYSTIGAATTWKAGLSWSPIEDIRFRGTFSQAIRAPNIFELFSPDLGTTFRPDDPCEAATIAALAAQGDPRAANRAANCAADGIPADFTDPLTARFTGVTGGNPDLEEEEADTLTVGFVFQPSFAQGLTLSVDYWDIEIEDAIDAVSAQDIVDNCYDSTTFPNEFCGLLGRNRDTNSAQFLGLNFIRQSEINFGKIESAGIDLAASYKFDIGENEFSAGLNGSWVDHLDFFFDPGDTSNVDPELGELARPELAMNVNLGWRRGPVTIGWQTQYQDEQGLREVEIEDLALRWGPSGLSDELWVHDLNFSYQFNENFRVYGGINNITDELPYITEVGIPVSGRGQSYFLGLNYSPE
ncbi:MAG: TonB-dependent receptor [Pseudomonadota bacterium]